MTIETDVLIVGAGPVGLLLATELARDGVAVRVVDRMRERSYFCKALGVTARTLEIFEDIGIVQDAIDAGVWLTGFAVFDHDKRVQAVDLPKERLPYGALSLPQFATERLLEQALRRHGVAVDYGWTFTGCTSASDGVVARAEDADGNVREFHCGWLVGCDGAHSKVRSGLRLDFAGDKYPQTFVLADVEVGWDLPRGGAYRFLHSRDEQAPPLVAIPIHGSVSRYRLSTILVNDAAGTDDREAAPDLARIKAILTPLLPPGTQLRDMRWSSVYRVSHRIVPTYGGGRVFIAGDAAHIHPPVGGQGMNTGLQDAHNLAWKLTLAARGLAASTLLASYSDERHPVGLDVVAETSRSMNEVLAQKSPQPGMRETQLLVGYRDSTIVSGDAPTDSAPLAPGDRAPDATDLTQPFVAHPRRLRERIGGGCHLLVGYVGANGQGLDTVVAMHGVLRSSLDDLARTLVIAPPDALLTPQEDVPVCTDASRSFATAYGATPGSAWLIRPDGHIGWWSATPSVDALQGYLRGIVREPHPGATGAGVR